MEKTILRNAALAFDKSLVVKEYKQEIENLKEENEKLEIVQKLLKFNCNII
jgi:cell division protein FtsB